MRRCPWHGGPDDPPYSTCDVCDLLTTADLDALLGDIDFQEIA